MPKFDVNCDVVYIPKKWEVMRIKAIQKLSNMLETTKPQQPSVIWSPFAHNSEQNLYLIGSPSTGQPRTTPRQASGCGGDCARLCLRNPSTADTSGDNWELWENVVARSMRIFKKKTSFEMQWYYMILTRRSPKQQVTQEFKFWAHLCWIGGIIVSRHPGEEGAPGGTFLVVCQNHVPLVNIKIARKWMFIPLKIVFIGIDP